MLNENSSLISGELFRHGQECDSARSYPEAAEWYLAAAERGHSGAQLMLGFACEYGKGVAQNPTEAVRWFREAADHGNAPAQSRMAYCKAIYRRRQKQQKDPHRGAL